MKSADPRALSTICRFSLHFELEFLGDHIFTTIEAVKPHLEFAIELLNQAASWE